MSRDGASGEQYARVILDIPTRALNTAFLYEIPPHLRECAQVGCCVLVDFAHRQRIAYIVELCSALDKDVQPATIKPIIAVLSDPYFDELSAQLAHWIAHEYLAPLNEAIRLFTPPGFSPRLERGEDGTGQLKNLGTGAVEDQWALLTEDGRGYSPPSNAVKQRAIIEALRIGHMRVTELALDISSPAASLKALEKRGVVRLEARRRFRGGAQAEHAQARQKPSISYAYRSADTMVLTDGQQHSLNAVLQALRNNAHQEAPLAKNSASCAMPFVSSSAALSSVTHSAPHPATPTATSTPPSATTFLLDGVTGSGKTEVYLQAIQYVLDRGGSALVLVPEISLTPQTVARFRSRFGDEVAVLHSRLSAGERFDQWDRVRLGDARVVIGARSALFAPLSKLYLIVIDEEHESTYKQSSSPRYVTRDVAHRLAALRGAVLVLGSATPSFETLVRCETDPTWMRLELPKRASGKPLPPVQVVNLSAEFQAGNKSVFSRVLREELTRCVERREKAVILLNKRGFASFLLCRDCGYVPMCNDCSTSLTYHTHPPRLTCHYCGARHAIPAICPECASPYFRELGPGTQYAEEQMAAFLPPGTPIIRMDADTTRGKQGHEACLSAFIAADHGILLGTQMIAKGLDFPEVTLVGVLIADITLKFPDFRSAERTYQLLEQVAGRAGRAEKDGRVIVQTYWPEHVAIRAAASHNREMVLEAERKMRAALAYPPYGRLARVLAWGENLLRVQEHIAALDQRLRTVLPSTWHVLGPSPCLLAKRQRNHRWHLLIKAPYGADISGAIGAEFRAFKSAEDVKLAIDIDPYDLM